MQIKWCLFILLFFSMGSLYAVEKLSIEAKLQTDPPQQTGNALLVTVKDSNGEPIEKAQVEAEYSMPAMGAMPAMQGKTTVAEQGNGTYLVKFDLPMGGEWTWTLNIKVKSNGESASVSYTFVIGRKGLTKVSDGSISQGETAQEDIIIVEEGRRQQIGVKIGEVIKAPFNLTIRAFGNVKYDETKLTDVVLRFQGWIRNLKANFMGQYVQAGQPLFSIYSPDLFSSQQEYLLALKSSFGNSNTLAGPAEQRLRLFGMTDQQIQELTQSGKPFEYLPILSPVNGYIIEKNVVEGDFVEAGQKLFRIASLDPIWVEAQVYQSDLALIYPNTVALISFPYLPGQIYKGYVNYILPSLQGSSRTGIVRIELSNPDHSLRPDMYANVEFKIDLGERLQVPTSAVIYTGKTFLVFLDLGQGKLKPQEIQIGRRSGDSYEVLAGLSEGDKVVTSGNFIIAAESRIRSAKKYWGDE